MAECAGLLYLCRELDGRPMVGAIDATATMTGRLTLGYRHATAGHDSLVARPGEPFTGHEFHRTRVQPEHGTPAAWAFQDTGYGARTEGFATRTLHASYLHVHWAGHPAAAERLVAAAVAHLEPARG